MDGSPAAGSGPALTTGAGRGETLQHGRAAGAITAALFIKLTTMAKGQNNLIPQSERTKDEQRRIARMGGIASGAARREKKHGQELVRALLEMDVKDPAVVEKLRYLGIDSVDNETLMHVRQIEKAQRTGDTKAYTAVMKYAGYDEQTVNINGPLIVPQDEMDALNKWAKKDK